jgi:hypothetical protein
MGRTTVQDEATLLRTAGGKAGRRTARRRRSPETGEDGVEEEDGAAAEEPRRPERPRHVGEEAARVPGADGGGPAVWRGRGCRRISGGRRWRIIPCGRGRGRRGRRRSGRMTAAEEEEDTTTTMAADRGRKSG